MCPHQRVDGKGDCFDVRNCVPVRRMAELGLQAREWMGRDVAIGGGGGEHARGDEMVCLL